MSDKHDYGAYSERDIALIAVGYYMADHYVNEAEAARYASWCDKNDIDEVLKHTLPCVGKEMAHMRAGGDE